MGRPPVDITTIDQSYEQLQAQSKQTVQAITDLAQKLQTAANDGDQNAREWLLDLKGVTLGFQQEQNQVTLLLQAIHTFVATQTQQEQAQQAQQQFLQQQQQFQQQQQQYQQQYQQQQYQQPMFQRQQGYYQPEYQQQGGFGRFMHSGFGQAMMSGAGFAIGEDIIEDIF
jgi:ABC-type transporter Mla subunit MlaD